jgi:hypothetical protein
MSAGADGLVGQARYSPQVLFCIRAQYLACIRYEIGNVVEHFLAALLIWGDVFFHKGSGNNIDIAFFCQFLPPKTSAGRKSKAGHEKGVSRRIWSNMSCHQQHLQSAGRAVPSLLNNILEVRLALLLLLQLAV